jgi:hypothetical protein
MTYFADLTPYSYLADDPGPWPELLNVGWLEPGRPFPTGPVPDGFLTGLARLCARPCSVTRGIHGCAFRPCIPRPWPPITIAVDGQEVGLGNAEVRVGTDGGTGFAAPTLVHHYVAAHGYAPPQPFVQAVLGSR